MTTYILPHSNPEKWVIALPLLGQPIRSFEALFARIEALSKLYDSILPEHAKGFDALRQSWSEFDDDNVFSRVIPYIQQSALELPELFPSQELTRLTASSKPGHTEQSICFSEEQVACLLAQMFFCTTAPQPPMKYWANFSTWYSSPLGPARAYLKTLFQYWLDLSLTKPTNRKIYFIRRTISNDIVPSWRAATAIASAQFPAVEIRVKGSIGDHEDEHSIEVDFANEDPMFGVGGTQEEIIFGASPELCISPLLCDSLDDSDVFIFSGMRRVGRLSGYGLDLGFEGPAPVRQDPPKPRFIAAMDALNFDSGEYTDPFVERKQLLRQLEEVALQREFSKALNAFSRLNGASPSVVETGHWGCGAYAGNPDLKAALQLLAASAARCTKLIYYCFGDDEFAERLSAYLNRARASGDAINYIIQTIEQLQESVAKSRLRDELPQLLTK